MPIMYKNIFIVKCNRDSFEKGFVRKKNSDVINFHEIHQKLTNNDSSKVPPSDDIVNFQIVKKLNKFRLCRKTEFIYMLSENIDIEFIDRLKSFFNGCYVPVYYHLLIDTNIEDELLLSEFNSATQIEYDKNSNPR
jgi:hypothetical protein